MIREKWENFLHGEWTKKRPTREGSYPTATRDGEYAGLRSIAFTSNGVYENGHHERDYCWGAFWWSVPLPDLPKPPDWEE